MQVLGIYIDPSADKSITAQLCDQLRQKIRQGDIIEGTRLPPSRKLAKEYGIARNVVIDVYEQLIAEGYLNAITGSGTYVAEGISNSDAERGDDIFWEGQAVSTTEAEDLAFASDEDDGCIDFMTGVPDLTLFPNKLWGKYLKAAAEEARPAQYDYSDIMGNPALRLEIAKYLYRTRGMRCPLEQIMIVAGSSEGLILMAHAFQSLYRSIYIEEPTIDFARKIFQHMNYRITPVDVDQAGMKVHEIAAYQPDHLMLITPSHQFPSGSILSIQRRQLAVKLAEQADSYIIEDDYDGDFRLKGVPIPPLATLDPARVLYLGTFSKTLAPGLRLGFIVIPAHLTARLKDVKEALNMRAPSLEQIALAQFMRDGRLDRHIHKMKLIYRHRRQRLTETIKRYFGERAVVLGDEAGMHVLVEFADDYEVDWQRSVEYGVRVHGVDDYYIKGGSYPRQILFGYGHVGDEEIEEGIRRLDAFVRGQVAGKQA